MKHLKRKRKSNYSVRETQTLIREIHKRTDVLFSRQQNTAINELKRQAWEEVARGVNSLGEGELRTAAEVKRRYLDWRALMKRKQLRAELSLSSSSSSSVALKTEYDQSSPEHETASLGSGCDQLLDLSGLSKDCHCDWPEEIDEDDIPSLLSEIVSRGEGHVGDVYSHNDLGMLRFRVAVEKQRLELEKQRLAVETERLAVEKERLVVEKERLRQMEVERERLQLLEKESKGWVPMVALETERLKLEKERLQLEKERLQFFKFEAGRLQIERERLQVEKERMQLHQGHWEKD
uniref:Myb/SANT-like DNA-binding domain-containing protein 4 n=1 Tax=Sander lucioperca TaxID=283035 RepID=A0A8C9YKH1_SANLU